MNYSAEERCRIWLKSVEGIGTMRFYQLMAHFGSAVNVWENLSEIPDTLKVSPKVMQALRSAHSDAYVNALFEKMEAVGMWAVTRDTPAYPEPLEDAIDPPPVLFLRGTAPTNYDRRFAIVGSRRATYEGKRAAREFAELLSENNVSIVSGLAAGIDTEAHTGALKGKTHTVAVLGCGADVVYPSSNRKLYDQIIAEGGLIVSEHAPGMLPLPQNFPLRNRIISGMSSGVLMVEGRINSGAMITVNYALDQGRDVFAVPGSIYSPLSAAPLQLIKEGASPVTTPQDILSYYQWGEETVLGRKRIEIALNEGEKRVVDALMDEKLSFDELIMTTFLPADQLNVHLSMLELRSIIVKLPGNLYTLNV